MQLLLKVSREEIHKLRGLMIKTEMSSFRSFDLGDVKLVKFLFLFGLIEVHSLIIVVFATEFASIRFH